MYSVTLLLLKKGKKVIIAVHGNTLHALVKYLDDVPDNGIVDLNILIIVFMLKELLH